MSMSTFLGRQPILDRDQRVVAYELLFRNSATASVAEFDSVERAAVRVMANTFATLGMDAVLGDALGFFNVSAEVLLSDAVEALPKERIVLEVLEDVEPTPEIMRRCRALSAAGYQIALDDWVVGDERECLLPYAKIVKVDLPAIPRADLRKLVRVLRRADVALLAEKVETAEEFALCHKIGFDQFQGFFFAKPIVIVGADLDPTRKTLIELLQQIAAESETDTIVETFKQDTKLGLSLLRLVNTAGRAARVRLESIDDAVRQLGLQQLSRWVAILLFAQGTDSSQADPLLISAAHRGRLMELIICAANSDRGSSGEAEQAFLVGMLSMADALLGRPIEALVKELSLGEEIARALTHQDGKLGRLLELAVAIERGDIDKFEPALENRGLDLESLQRLEHDAYAWVHGLSQNDCE